MDRRFKKSQNIEGEGNKFLRNQKNPYVNESAIKCILELSPS